MDFERSVSRLCLAFPESPRLLISRLLNRSPNQSITINESIKFDILSLAEAADGGGGWGGDSGGGYDNHDNDSGYGGGMGYGEAAAAAGLAGGFLDSAIALQSIDLHSIAVSQSVK